MKDQSSVVAYLRVSTLEQQKHGYGIDIQMRDVERFAEVQNLKVCRFYRDEGESGILENRKELRKLLRDCRKGQVNSVIIPSLDRLSRDLRLSENLFWQFANLGVQVLIADMPNYNAGDRRDVLVRQIRAAIAEENRKDIIERLFKGRQERARRGEWPGGTVPYGFLRQNKKLIPHVNETQAVRRIFNLADAGVSSSDVASELNEAGFRRRNQAEWTSRQVRAILGRRNLYQTGRVRYGEVFATNERMILLSDINAECA